jgi:arylsulfatase A-like enzyme
MFLYVSFNAPHSPLQAPDDAIAQYMDIEDMHRRVYAAMVSELDHGIGQILATLDNEGLGDDTLVLFMSDNGGAKSLGADNGPFRGGKGSTLQGGIRVPAIVRWPDRLKAGTTHDQLIAVEDILPTLFGALDLSPEWINPLDGSDQWPAIADAQAVEQRVRILTRHNREQYFLAIFDSNWKLVRTQGYESRQTETKLFRIRDDPYEQHDQAAKYPDVVDKLLALFRRMPQATIVGIDDPPIPTRTGLGGPMSPIPDDRPPNREPYAESAVQD